MKILWGALVVDGRNKIGGQVASKNRYGAYMRNKVTPVNPQTELQQNVRGRFGARASAWRGLTEPQRQSWIDAAPNFPILDIFGNSKILSGASLYQSLNLNLAQAGQAAITTAPSPVAITSLVSLAVEYSSGDINVTAGIAAVPAGMTAIVFATPPYGAGQYFVKNKYRFLRTVAAAGAINPVDISSAYGDAFGTPPVGQKFSVTMFLVVNATGQAGVPFSAFTIRTA
jgi:hypothetical protein